MGVTEQHTQHLDGWIDGTKHSYYLRVQYEDTDVGGITYHAQYLAFAERARSAFLRLMGIDQSALLSEDALGFVVRHIANLKHERHLVVVQREVGVGCFAVVIPSEPAADAHDALGHIGHAE